MRKFHQQHFPGQITPEPQPTSGDSEDIQTEHSSLKLGFYEDGVRRTLTDEQISMFRHSEIHRLLSERRQQKELEEEQKQKQERINQSLKKKSLNLDRPSQLETDADVHTRTEAAELSYDDSVERDAKGPKMFLWPKLGL